MEKLKKRLLEKGWEEKEAEKAARITAIAKESRHPAIKKLDKAVYWIALSVAVFGNFVISIALVPVLIALKGIGLYLTVIVLGVSFGLLIELLVRSIEHLERKHHVFLGIFLPAIALVNLVIIANIAFYYEKILKISNPHNPFLVGIVYALAFIAPFLLYKVLLKKDYYSG
ncbi:hypothetical protein J4212_03535 [Candidatus Woesearchaeota archaeon]|nr:hypothetical protein [Candidatus Woesearchaeota archaeon]